VLDGTQDTAGCMTTELPAQKYKPADRQVTAACCDIEATTARLTKQTTHNLQARRYM